MIASIFPITVVVAISLFVAKEVLEAFRRHQANERKLSALKKMMARELAVTAFAIGNLEGALRHMSDHYSGADTRQIKINKDTSGLERIELADDDDVRGSGHPLFKPKDDVMLKHLLDVAALDGKLFEQTEAAIDATVQARHIRDGIIENVLHPHDFSQGFPKYGHAVLEDSLARLKLLYKACTGRDEFEKRVR